MALVTRISRLFQADFHAVLDRIEEPDLQLRQAEREMQLALDQDRQRLQLLQHEAGQLEKLVASYESDLHSFDEELDICLAAEKDDLARDLVRRKLATGKPVQANREQVASVAEQCQALTRQIEEQSQQLASMQQKLELLASTSDKSYFGDYATGESVRNEEVEIALLREKQRRTES